MGGNEALAFDMGYARWLDEYQRLINDQRSVVNSHVGDNELRILVDSNMATCNAWSYDEHLIRIVICCGLCWYLVSLTIHVVAKWMDTRSQLPKVLDSVVIPAKGIRTGCPNAPSDGFVSHG